MITVGNPGGGAAPEPVAFGDVVVCASCAGSRERQQRGIIVGVQGCLSTEGAPQASSWAGTAAAATSAAIASPPDPSNLSF